MLECPRRSVRYCGCPPAPPPSARFISCTSPESSAAASQVALALTASALTSSWLTPNVAHTASAPSPCGAAPVAAARFGAGGRGPRVAVASTRLAAERCRALQSSRGATDLPQVQPQHGGPRPRVDAVVVGRGAADAGHRRALAALQRADVAQSGQVCEAEPAVLRGGGGGVV